MNRNQRRARAGVPSGRERFPVRLGIIEEGHRLEPVAACPAMPEIGRAARARFNPVRGGDRLAALGAGIFVGQIAEVYSGHGATPFFSPLEGELDRFAVGYTCPCRLGFLDSIASFERRRRRPQETPCTDVILRCEPPSAKPRRGVCSKFTPNSMR